MMTDTEVHTNGNGAVIEEEEPKQRPADIEQVVTIANFIKT